MGEQKTTASSVNRAKTYQLVLFPLNNGATNVYYVLVLSYIATFGSKVLALSMLFASVMVTGMRLFDAVTDPIIGALMDRTNGRFGKFRPFMVIGNLIMAASILVLYCSTPPIPPRPASPGRNFEYYAEDPFVAGPICAAEVQGIQSKGVYVYLKHVALNDSETSRRGVNTWLNEQTAREIYLEVADKAITDGGAWCVMTGFNRWGATWCGANANLLNGFLREELGMRGMCITDFSGSSQYMDLVDGLIAGSDIWDSPMPKIHTTKAANYENDAYIVTQMRNAMHHILYTVVNSNAMNGWSASDTLKTVLPWWQTAIYALIAVLAVLTVLCAWQLSKALKRKKELADTAPAVDQK